MTDIWDLWFPGAGASGLSFCRAKISAEAGGKSSFTPHRPSSTSR